MKKGKENRGAKLDALQVACVFLGCVIGAGFASGREIYSYFVVYRERGFLGILVFSAFIFITLFCLTELIVSFRLRNQRQALHLCFGHYAGRVLFIFITSFCFCEFSVMAAGFDALMVEHFDVSRGPGFVVFVFFMYFLLLFGKPALLRLNALLSPVMLWSIVFICIFVLLIKDVGVFQSVIGFERRDMPYMSAMLYWGYNALTGVGVLCALGDMIRDKGGARRVTAYCTLLFVFAVLIVFLALGAYYKEIGLVEMPVLALAGKGGAFVKSLYSVAVAFALITTAAAAAFAVTACAPPEKNPLILFLICAGSFLFFSFDFSYLVDNLYAFFGIAGVVLCFGIIAKYVLVRWETLFKSARPAKK